MAELHGHLNTVDEALRRILGLTPGMPSQADYKAVSAYLYAGLLRYLPRGDYEPEDLLQDSIQKAFAMRHTIRNGGSLKFWFNSIARNVLRDWIRKRARMQREFRRFGDTDEARSILVGGACTDTESATHLRNAERDSFGNPSITLKHIHRRLQIVGKPQLTRFFEAQVKWLELLDTCGRVNMRGRMKYVMAEVGLKRNSEYNSLSRQLKAATAHIAQQEASLTTDEEEPT